VPLSALVGTLSIEAINRLAQGRRPSTVRCIIVIPSRFASTRLPGKPLLKETGKYLVQHVYEQALLSKRANHVVVATDDDRIEAA
jgi:CMP-2-keto-3-deoxyoctulosonic acid synthetase